MKNENKVFAKKEEESNIASYPDHFNLGHEKQRYYHGDFFNVQKITWVLLMLFYLVFTGSVSAVPAAPTLSLEQENGSMTVRWSEIEGDPEYILSFAPYPTVDYIHEINMQHNNEISFETWPGAAYYVAIQAEKDGEVGPYSNIEHFIVPETPLSPDSEVSDSNYEPFIDNNYFDFAYGDVESGERLIDSQYASSAYYNMDETGMDQGSMFGVNFADGRIKGYGLEIFGNDKTFYVIYVRDNKSKNYGVNQFRDNGDATITDLATGLMWMKDDSGYGMVWQDALSYCEDLTFAGYSDWRLPNAKELQSIVDYTRMPDANEFTTPSKGGPAIDTDFFNITSFININGDKDWGYFWSSTTHKSSNGMGGSAAYVAFGRGLGNIDGNGNWVDVHGAGCQRSDPKKDDGTDYSNGHGPQGDAIYIYNYVRPVRYDKSVTAPTYTVVDTNQKSYWNNAFEIEEPSPGAEFYGQDAHYSGNALSYTDNGDGTITDNNTKLMWQKSPDTNKDGVIGADDKYTYAEAIANAALCNTGGYNDWRLPTIKELYSLIQFSGSDVSMESELDLGEDISDNAPSVPVYERPEPGRFF
ncbi:hypothetical protein MTBBW1_460007 [Desulfamplus magnetovallimortis]|uniref:Lcl C-terminal domain-containing protein n=1 Tax=Desulfamplus magnetovallimortis TaxID=1246637 RepID=A0A1W1HH69_9BACT|nr:DUF1566 domain-containing protein [Desulfamplus magnetovallimortis]SLM31851.1 hypothetical protein MTBBW1_460007 [Desulfamplus magnetovallimortis]